MNGNRRASLARGQERLRLAVREGRKADDQILRASLLIRRIRVRCDARDSAMTESTRKDHG